MVWRQHPRSNKQGEGPDGDRVIRRGEMDKAYKANPEKKNLLEAILHRKIRS